MKRLERQIGLASAIALSIGAMFGIGAFVLPGPAAGIAGPNVWLAFVIAGLIIIPGSISKAEIGTAIPESDGDYLYIERALGPVAGTIAGLGV